MNPGLNRYRVRYWGQRVNDVSYAAAQRFAKSLPRSSQVPAISPNPSCLDWWSRTGLCRLSSDSWCWVNSLLASSVPVLYLLSDCRIMTDVNTLESVLYALLYLLASRTSRRTSGMVGAIMRHHAHPPYTLSLLLLIRRTSSSATLGSKLLIPHRVSRDR